MSPPRFYIPADFSEGGLIQLPQDEAVHALRVLRLEEGDAVTLLNGKGAKAEAILSIDGEPARRARSASCKILAVQKFDRPCPAITLYVAPPRNKNMETVLKAATELGASEIVPILCRYGVAKPEKDATRNWRLTLIAAAKQSANPWLPEIHEPMDFGEALQGCQIPGVFGAVPAPEDTPQPFPDPRGTPRLALWIGPEGGFAPEEDQALRDRDVVPFTVGSWTLRVETATIALLAAVLDRYATTKGNYTKP